MIHGPKEIWIDFMETWSSLEVLGGLGFQLIFLRDSVKEVGTGEGWG